MLRLDNEAGFRANRPSPSGAGVSARGQCCRGRLVRIPSNGWSVMWAGLMSGDGEAPRENSGSIIGSLLRGLSGRRCIGRLFSRRAPHYAGFRPFRACLVVFLAAACHVPSSKPAQADEFGAGLTSAWQFRTASETMIRSNSAQMIQRVESGESLGPLYTINNTTKIFGDQIICEIVATSIGNTATTSNVGESGAPSILNSPVVTASAIGNVAGGEAGDPLNAGGRTGTNTIEVQQNVNDSSQTSTVGQTDQSWSAGDVGGTSSRLVQRVTNEQSMNNSPLNSSVSNSTACYWR